MLGMRVAIDDVGAGYVSMRLILKIQPDIIKLDISLTQGIDTDATRRALAAALIAFSGEPGTTIVAEGAETKVYGSGFIKRKAITWGRPAPLAELIAPIAACESARVAAQRRPSEALSRMVKMFWSSPSIDRLSACSIEPSGYRI